MSSTRPERLGMRAAAQEASVEQLSRLARRDGAIADAAGSRFDLDKRLEPKEAARSGADKLNVEAAAARFVANCVCDAVRADGERRRIRGNEDARRSLRLRLARRDDRVDPIAIQTADRLAVERAQRERERNCRGSRPFRHGGRNGCPRRRP